MPDAAVKIYATLAKRETECVLTVWYEKFKKLNVIDKDLTGNRNRVLTNHLNTVRNNKKRKRVPFTTSLVPLERGVIK